MGDLGIPQDKKIPGEIISFSSILERVLVESSANLNEVTAPKSTTDKKIVEDAPHLIPCVKGKIECPQLIDKPIGAVIPNKLINFPFCKENFSSSCPA